MLGDSCVDLGQGFPNYDPPDFVVQVPKSWGVRVSGSEAGEADVGEQFRGFRLQIQGWRRWKGFGS